MQKFYKHLHSDSHDAQWHLLILLMFGTKLNRKQTVLLHSTFTPITAKQRDAPRNRLHHIDDWLRKGRCMSKMPLSSCLLLRKLMICFLGKTNTLKSFIWRRIKPKVKNVLVYSYIHVHYRKL